MYYIIQAASAFFATLFFAMLFQAARRTLFLAGVCGMLGWITLLLTTEMTAATQSYASAADSLFFSNFIAALIIGLTAKIISESFKIPVTNILIPGIITIVPGGLIYTAMTNIASNNMNGFLNDVKNTVIVGGSIALAIFFESAAFEKLPIYYQKIMSFRLLGAKRTGMQAARFILNSGVNYSQIIKTAMMAGDILLRSGGEVFRVEETINRICSTSGVAGSGSFVTPTGIFISIERDDGEPMTLVNRVSSRSINLSKISDIDRTVDEYGKGKLTLADFFGRLEEIGKAKGYPALLLILAGGLTAAFFSVLYKGDLIDALSCFAIGSASQAAALYMKNNKMQDVIVYIIGGAVLALMEIIVSGIVTNHFDIVIMGSIMIFVPGVAITNAIREAITGDYISSVARGMEALVVASAIAIGIGIVLRLAF